MVETPPSRQRRPPCRINKRMFDETAFVAALTYLLTYLLTQQKKPTTGSHLPSKMLKIKPV